MHVKRDPCACRKRKCMSKETRKCMSKETLKCMPKETRTALCKSAFPAIFLQNAYGSYGQKKCHKRQIQKMKQRDPRQPRKAACPIKVAVRNNYVKIDHNTGQKRTTLPLRFCDFAFPAIFLTKDVRECNRKKRAVGSLIFHYLS